MKTTLRIEADTGRAHLPARWTVREAAVLNAGPALASEIDAKVRPGVPVVLDASAVSALDTAGALVLLGLAERLRAGGREVEVTGLDPDQVSLLTLVEAHPARPVPPVQELATIEVLAASARDLSQNALGFLSFLGHVFIACVAVLLRPRTIRGALLVRNLQTAGVDALPIIGLLSFLIGIVIAYQGSMQLHRYGADIFIVDLVGLSIVRELAPLITAIIVAGRTGSAFTAQIGTMRVTEEIDALRVIGLSPVDILVRPKVFALLIALPLLTAFADVISIAGGVIMAASMTQIGPAFFLEQFPRVVSGESYLVGIGKAPVFAFVIASVGCQGFQASDSAESVGSRTTISVVQSIFLIIVLDAMFSIVFSIVGI